MRVITGSARGRKLESPENYDIRPTTDKVKEAVFSIIQFELEGRVFLDLFAGSGQMGIEALSRGAKKAVFVDASKKSFDIVKRNLQLTGLSHSAQVELKDSLAFLSSNQALYDIVFMDPPYHNQLISKALPLLIPHLNEQSVVICECAKDEELPQGFGHFTVYREYQYSSIRLTVYRYLNGEKE